MMLHQNSLTSTTKRLSLAGIIALSAFSTQALAQFTFTGATGNDWNTGTNWTHSTNPDEVPGAILDEQAVIPGGQTVTLDAAVPNIRAIRVGEGGSGTATLHISEGADLSANTVSSWDSTVGRDTDGVVYQTGGAIDINYLELGRDGNGAYSGQYYLSGGTLNFGRGGHANTGSNGLMIGVADSSANGTGDGYFEISGGALTTRAGIWMGGTGGNASAVFSVIGSNATEIGIGTQNAGTDGRITVNPGATIKSRIDYGGLTKILIDDHGNGNNFATFENGSQLDVGYFNTGQAGTWTVLELENGAITDNGLAFAPGVDTGIWTFNIDNTGTNGLLTVTSTGAAVTSGDITWDGSEDTNYHNGLNWDNDTGPFTAGDHAYINSGTVEYTSGTTPNLRSLRLLGGNMTVSGGSYQATFNPSQHSIIDGTFYQTGGTVTLNQLEIGRVVTQDGAADGAYYLSSGDMIISRALGDISLYLGGNHDNNPSGTGLIEIKGGSFKTRRGVKLGHATETGTGTFTVLGSAATEIGIGSQNDLDGSWEQHAGSTLKVGIDYGGVTKIFIDDVEGTNSTYATFESGSLLDVDYYAGGSGGGTWVVMEVENGDIDAGVGNANLSFAPGVDTDVWSFNIDNTGTNGVLTVSATGNPNGIVLTVGNTLKQQMRYGIDYERLWFWQGSSSVRDRFAQWSVDDCDVDYVRVAINSKYELTEGVFQEDAYWDADDNEGGGTNNDRIIPMMQDMQDANPNIKFFASPRPLNEAVSGVAWQPYPQWITGSTGNNSNFSFDEVKCSEYLLRYLILMKQHGFKISYMDLTNEWNFVTAKDVRDISALFDDYLDGTKPVIHPDYPTVTLVADDIPLLIAPSAWSYTQGRSWMNGVIFNSYREALDIASCHNTDKGGTAQGFADRVREKYEGQSQPVPEIWNTEVHGWKSTSNADEVLTFAYMMECINAGFSGLNGWLAVGFSNQGHCYIVNSQRSVKYYIFEKLTNTSNRGYALDVNEPSEFKAYWDPDPDQQDADSAVSALIRGNLMTVWVLNHSNLDHPTTIVPTGRTISDEPIKFTRWSQFDGLSSEGVTGSIPRLTDTSVFVTVEDNSAYCFEILLEPETLPYTRIEAESFDGSNPSNHSTEACSDTDGGLNLSNINDGNWTRYDSVDLDEATNIRLRVAAPSGRPDGKIEIRTGSETGTLIGKVAVPVTGGWQDWCTIETPLDPTSGTHDLYLVYVEADSNQSGSGALFNLNWFELALPAASTPSAPTNLTATANGSTQIDLAWDAVSGATSYRVLRATSAGGTYSEIESGLTTTSTSDASASVGVTYYYVVRAVNGAVESTDSNIASATLPLLAPTNLTATANGSTQIDLAWDAVSGATSYRVLRATSAGGTYTEIESGLATTSTSDATASIGVTYFYVVRAIAGAVESTDSNIDSATLPLLAPTSLTATANGSTQIDLAWDAVPEATSYRVLRATSAGGTYTEIATGVTTTSTSDATASIGIPYYYVVRAIAGAVESANSNEADATLPPEKPTGLNAIPISASQIDLSWNSVTGATSYTVQKSSAPRGPYTDIATGIVLLSYSDTVGLTPGTLTYYRVYASAGTVDSLPSSATSVVPSNPVDAENILFSPLTIDFENNNVDFSILNSELGHNYQAQQRQDLTIGDWVDVGAVKQGNGGILDFTIPIMENDVQYFYRVDITQQ